MVVVEGLVGGFVLLQMYTTLLEKEPIHVCIARLMVSVERGEEHLWAGKQNSCSGSEGERERGGGREGGSG